jgi:hypothetical protein
MVGHLNVATFWVVLMNLLDPPYFCPGLWRNRLEAVM